MTLAEIFQQFEDECRGWYDANGSRGGHAWQARQTAYKLVQEAFGRAWLDGQQMLFKSYLDRIEDKVRREYRI
jgi:hypothetical protein